MRKSNVGRNRLLAAVALIACLCMMILAGCTGVSRSADKPVLDEATVVRVVDGDTFVANIDGQDEKIRLIGVDTPESVNPDESKNTERGKEASENTKSILTKGKHVWLEADVQDEDKYNRKLRYVWLEKPTDSNNREQVESEMLNAVLVKDGWADPMEIAPNTKWASMFDELSGDA